MYSLTAVTKKALMAEFRRRLSASSALPIQPSIRRRLIALSPWDVAGFKALSQARQTVAWNLVTTTPDSYLRIAAVDPEMIARVRQAMGSTDLIQANCDPLEALEPARLEEAARQIPDRVLQELRVHGVDFAWLHFTARFDETIKLIPPLTELAG